MNELRRKIVLGSPLLSVGLFSGCVDSSGDAGQDDMVGSATNGRATPQAKSSSAGQTLIVSAAPGNLLVDDIWWNTNGAGLYFVPSASPSIQALVNGNALHVAMVEQVALSTSVKIIKSMMLTLNGAAAPALNAAYTIDGTVNTAQIRLLKRTTSGTTITDQIYGYAPNGSGTVKIAAVSSGPTFKLTFSSVRFQAASGTLASKGLSLSGDATLTVPTETVAWI